MDSLINIDGFSDVANNLIDKISSAVGWIVTHDTPHRIAVKTYIEEIQNSNMDPLVKGILINNANKTIRESDNQVNIIQKAISMMTDASHVNEVENDWIAAFMDKARLISDEDIQLILAKILSGEMEKPGSFSLRSLDKLKNLSKSEAEVFQKIAKISCKSNDNVFIFDDTELMNKFDVCFSDIILLDDCGLISSRTVYLSIRRDEHTLDFIMSNDVVGVFHGYHDSFENKLVSLSIFMFSEFGRELLRAISVDIDESYLIDVLKKTKKANKNCVITAHRITSFVENNIEYSSEDLLAE